MKRLLTVAALLLSTHTFAADPTLQLPSDGTGIKIGCHSTTQKPVISTSTTTTVTIRCVSPSPSPSVSPSPLPSPTASPTPSPSPSSSPTSTPSVQKVLLLDGFEKPELASQNSWKGAINRTILDGQVTSVVLKSSAPCELISVAGIQKMIPVNITKTSAPSYKAGTYFDALEPLSAANCNGTQFMQIDTSAPLMIGDAQINIIKKKTKAPATPNIVLNSEFNNWNMVQRFCGGGYCAAESYGTGITKILNDHKVSVYKAWPGGSTPWTTYQLPYSIGSIYVGWGDATGLGQIPWANLTKPTWAYVHDEPKYYDFNEVISKLSNWKKNYPSVKRMVTTSIRARDFNPSSPNFGKVVDLPVAMKNDTDIFTPVAEAFCQETWKGSGDFYPCKDAYAGKELWLYISNMSHGAEDGSATGAPDIMIDRGAVEMFGFYLMAIKYDISNLLYYNTIQNWEVVSQNLTANPYIFGGNGDGLLLYPDTKNKSAFTSIRLKLIREASNWADIVIAAGLQSKAKALMTNTLTWNRDLSAFESLRTEALAALP